MLATEAFAEPWQVIGPVYPAVSHSLPILIRRCEHLVLICSSGVVNWHQTASLLVALVIVLAAWLMRLLLQVCEVVAISHGLLDQLFLQGTPVNFLELCHLERLLGYDIATLLLEPNRTIEVLQV